MKNNMTTKIKFLSIFLLVPAALIIFSTLSFPQLVMAQSGGSCGISDAGGSNQFDFACFEECRGASSESQCASAGWTAESTALPSRKGVANSVAGFNQLAQQGGEDTFKTDCTCEWFPGNDDGGGWGPGETCSDGVQNQNETGVDIGGVCTPPVEYQICTIDSFNPASFNLGYNTGTSLTFQLSAAFDWDMTIGGGTTLPSPRSGSSAGATVSTGNLTQTQTYTLNCYYPYAANGSDAIETRITSQSRTVTVSPEGFPPSDTCNDPNAVNYGEEADCEYLTETPSSLCSPMVEYANVIGCPDVENQQKSSEQECLAWCNANGADGCRYTRGGVGAGSCYRFEGSSCDIEYDTSNFAWLASVAECVNPPPTLNPTVTPSVSCVPSGQSSYTATISWPLKVDNNIRVYIDDVIQATVGIFSKDVYGGGTGSGSGSTSAPAGFHQERPDSTWQNLVLSPGATYNTTINNIFSTGQTVSWSVPQCATTIPAEGNLDAGSCDIFGGWAWDPDFPNNPTSVRFYQNGVFYSSAPASALRSDLVTAGYGNGNHGFTITTPDAWKTGTNQTISVYVVDLNSTSTPQIAGSPKTINCPSTSVSLSLQGLGCQIPIGSSACAGSVTWEVTNPVSGVSTTLAKTNPSSTSSVPPSGSGSMTLNYGDTFLTMAHAGQSKEALVSAACVSGSSWNGSICAATPPSFDYTLSNSGNSSVVKGNTDAYTTNTITKSLVSGTPGSVTLSLSGVPSGVSYSLSNGSCAPGCSSVITFTVSPSAPVGTHQIVVTGSPYSKTTSFNLIISGSPLPVSCSASASSVFVGQPVTWSGSISGGTPPYTYSWSGTNLSAPLPSTNPFTRTYTTVGQKTAQLTVTDADGTQGICQAATVQVNFDPDFEEF